MNTVLTTIEAAFTRDYPQMRYLILPVVTILGLICLRILRKDKMAGLLAVYMAVTTGIFFFPVTALIIQKLLGESVYFRTIWLVPVIPGGAYFLTQVVYLRSKKWMRALALICACAFIILTGEPVFSDTYFSKRENNFKMPTEVIYVADAINQHAQENGVEEKRIIGPADVATYIRLYDATIIQKFGRETANKPSKQRRVYGWIHSDEPEYDRLCKAARNLEYCYIVFRTRSDDEEAMKNNHFEKIFGDDTFVVYFDTDSLLEKE